MTTQKRKADQRLSRRINGWQQTMNEKARPPSGIGKRVETGGYHKPGSNNK